MTNTRREPIRFTFDPAALAQRAQDRAAFIAERDRREAELFEQAAAAYRARQARRVA